MFMRDYVVEQPCVVMYAHAIRAADAQGAASRPRHESIIQPAFEPEQAGRDHEYQPRP